MLGEHSEKRKSFLKCSALPSAGRVFSVTQAAPGALNQNLLGWDQEILILVSGFFFNDFFKAPK